jgi:hypothetical protein
LQEKQLKGKDLLLNSSCLRIKELGSSIIDNLLKEKDKEIMKLNRRILDLENKVEGNKLVSFIEKLKLGSQPACVENRADHSTMQYIHRGDKTSEDMSLKQDTASFHQSNNTSFNN